MSTALAQLSQYLRWVYPAVVFIVVQPLALILVWWLTQKICAKRHDRWMALYGPPELKRRNLDLQNQCAERGRRIKELEDINAAILASHRAASVANAHTAQCLEGVPDTYGLHDVT